MRLLSTGSTIAIVAASVIPISGVHAQAANTTPANVNVLNLLSPFLALNANAVGQQTLQLNLSQALATNNNAPASLQALSVSDKNLFGGRTNTITLSNNTTATYGVAANLAGGLPAQAAVSPATGARTTTPTTPIQAVGGLGAVLGPIFQQGVQPIGTGAATTAILANTANLLVNAYNFTSSDLGVAKNYFANGAANNPSVTPAGYVATPAVAPAGYTLPTFNGLPNTTNSVLDLAYGVTNTQPGQDVYGSSRPVQVSPTGINQFDSTSLIGLTTNPSFPSGHTNYAYTDSMLIAMLVPQDYQSMLLRASAYANSRIVLGVHYPLDIIASRAFSAYDLAQAFTNPLYFSNASTTGAAINLAAGYNAAKPELQTYLAAQCGASVATCSTSPANTANDPYVPSSANQALYQANLTYGLPTLTYAQAPREAAPSGGPDASILLAPLYGGITAAALAIAPAGGIYGTLQTNTIDQIIVNTETNALAAFYGTALSYWARLDLYTAAGYFQNVTGTLSLAPTDVVTTNVTVGNTGVLDANGTVTGTTTVASGGTLAGAGTASAVTVANGGALAPGSLAARASLLVGTTGVAGIGLAVTGPLAFAAGSTLSVVATPTQVTKVTVSGATAISGGTVAVQAAAAAAFVPMAAYTILTATGGIAGTFTDATSSLPFLSANLSYDANDVFLSLNRNAQALAAAAGTRNERNVALAIGNSAAQGTTGASGALLNAVFGQGSTQQARTTFDNLSGEGVVGVENAGIRAARVFSGAINDQATSWLTGDLGAVNSIVVGSGLPSGVLGYAQTDAMVSPIVVDRTPAPRTYRVWSTGFGGGISISGNANLAEQTGNFYGGVLGLDYQVQPNILVGIAAGGSDSSFNVSSRSTYGDVTGFHGGIYSIVDFGPFYALNSFNVSSFSNNTTRSVNGFGGLTTGMEKASFGSHDIRTHAEFGRVLDYGRAYGFANLKITPFVALEIAQLRTNGFTEYDTSGASNVFGLAGQGQATADVPGFVGARFESSYIVGPDIVLRPMVSLAYLHEFATARNLQNGFIALPGSTFLVSGARPSSNAAQTKAGFDLDLGRGIGFFANFDGEFSDLARVYGGKGGIRVIW